VSDWTELDERCLDAVCAWPAQDLPADVLDVLVHAPHEPAAQTPAGTAPAATPARTPVVDGQVEGAPHVAPPSPQGTIDYPPPDEPDRWTWTGRAILAALILLSLAGWAVLVACFVAVLMLCGPATLAGVGFLLLAGFIVWRECAR